MASNFYHVIWISIGIFSLQTFNEQILATFKQRDYKILHGYHVFKDQQFNFDLWSSDLNINRGYLHHRTSTFLCLAILQQKRSRYIEFELKPSVDRQPHIHTQIILVPCTCRYSWTRLSFPSPPQRNFPTNIKLTCVLISIN